MKLLTKRFGELDIREEEIYLFKDGIPGFEQEKSFVLIEVEEHEPFSYLQSVMSPDLAFALIDPFLVNARYEFDLADGYIEDLQLAQDHRLVIRSIVSVRDSLNDATVNLVAPIVLNVNQRKGKQIVLTEGDYSTRHQLIDSSGNK